MKIEINYEDVEALRRDISRLQKKNEELEAKIKSLDEKALKKQATDLAQKLFLDVMHRVFDEFGFEDRTWLGDVDFGHLEQWLGKHWFTSDRLNITIGATVTNQFRKAFIRMGVACDKNEE